MLTVTTFSLSTMVSAYSAATSNVTPRATRLVMEDSTTQNVLATFVGSFLFSLVGIFALTTGAYGEQGRLFLFIVTMGVIALIVVTLLRWIDHLSRLGRVTETTERVEKATLAAMRAWLDAPYLGGHMLNDTDKHIGGANSPITVREIGYVQHIDAGAMSKIADEVDFEIAIVARPGKLVTPGKPIAWASQSLEREVEQRIAACFTIGDVRSFDQDPRFGASVLAEIASRALSPAVNDPGTAIDVISRAMRILAVCGEEMATEVDFPRLRVVSLEVSDLFDALFTPIARDGAGLIEVGLRLQKALVSLSLLGIAEFKENAARHSQDALARSDVVMQH